MSKVLKVFIVLILLLSISALVLGTILFGQREMLKARTQRMEQAVVDFAKSIRYGEVDREAIMDLDRMDQPLNTIAAQGDVLYQDLQDTKQDLENTREELAVTKSELADTRQELADARDRIGTLESNLAQTEAELNEANDQIDVLKEEKQVLISQVDDLETELTQANEAIQDLRADIETLEGIIKELEGAQGDVVELDPGLSGEILTVNEPWNFVVLNIGKDVGLVPNAEMVVHRDDELVGKVRISRVQENMAVADIISDWQQVDIQSGDQVMYVVF